MSTAYHARYFANELTRVGGAARLEKFKRRHRQSIFDVEDEIMAKRDGLIEKLEKRMRQRSTAEPLFTIRWSLV